MRNDADSLLYSTERSLTEHKAKLDAATIAEVEKAMAEAREAAGKDDLEVLKERVKALQTASMKIGQAVYATAGSASGTPGEAPGGGAKPEDGGKEAEFTDGAKKKE